MKTYKQYTLNENSSNGEVNGSNFYVIMLEKSNEIPVGLIEDYNSSNSSSYMNGNVTTLKYIKDFVYDRLMAREKLDTMDTFELIKNGFQSKDECLKFFKFINEQIEIVIDSDDHYREEFEKWHGKLVMKEFIAIAQASTGNLNFE